MRETATKLIQDNLLMFLGEYKTPRIMVTADDGRHSVGHLHDIKGAFDSHGLQLFVLVSESAPCHKSIVFSAEQVHYFDVSPNRIHLRTMLLSE